MNKVKNRLFLYLSDENNRRKLAPFISITLGLIIGGILMIIIGKNPFVGYYEIINGAIFKGLFKGELTRLGGTLAIVTVLIFTGLAVAFAFKTGLFNIGVGGQMYFGGFIAVYLGNTLNLPRFLTLIICILGAMIGGSFWALIPGILKAKYRISEVVSTIMMNYIALWTVSYFVRKYIPKPFQDTESQAIKAAASLKAKWLTNLFDGSAINLSIFLAIIVGILIWFILNKTSFGYELKAVGHNHEAARYAGIDVKFNIIAAMMISGAIAGLAGASYYIGYTNHIRLGSALPAFGFDGIAVSLLGLNAPIGVALAALLLGTLRTGGEWLQSINNIPRELVDVISSLIIYFAAASLLIQNILSKQSKKLSKSKKEVK